MGLRLSEFLIFHIFLISPLLSYVLAADFLAPERQAYLSTPIIQNELHPPQHNSSKGQTISFRLASVYATTNSSSHILFADVEHRKGLVSGHQTPTSYTISTRKTLTHKPSSLQAFNQARFSTYSKYPNITAVNTALWEEDEVIGPDITDRETLLLLAKMTNNAYSIDKEEDDWYDIGDEWKTAPFGWDPDDDGFRGHVFISDDKNSVIISIKGTSAAVLGRGGPTAKKDKLNDNLLFSCCCAKVGFSWTPVCDCYIDGWRCNQNCLEQSLLENSLFYPIGINLYSQVIYTYPTAKIWIIGHSLGGSLASLLGATFGTPVVAFEAPGERLAAQRLHLPSPPSTLHITHVYHTADPIPMGVCTGIFSTCALVGYALESRCHLGRSIVYDTVTKLNWSVNIGSHRIRTVVDSLLSQDWEGQSLPNMITEDDCVDCYSWEFVDP